MPTILVTDDNSEYRANVLDILRLENYNVIEANNGKEAWEKMRQYQPELVLCDIDMPIMTGLEVLEMVKADHTFKHIPFVIVSGNADDATVDKVYKLGADGFIQKPMNIPEMLALIDRLLNNRS